MISFMILIFSLSDIYFIFTKNSVKQILEQDN